MNDEQASSENPWGRYVARALGGVGLLLVVIVFVLCFGSPQFHKSIYMFQSWCTSSWPPPGQDPVEKSFSGTWREWYRNGQLASKRVWQDGILMGPSYAWTEDGVRVEADEQVIDADGNLHGRRTRWYPDGNLALEEQFNHQGHGYAKTWTQDGDPLSAGEYRGHRRWSGSFVTLQLDVAAHREIRNPIWLAHYRDGKRVETEGPFPGSYDLVVH